MKALIFISLVGLVSCTTTQKAIRQLDRDRPAAAQYCADRFPVRDSVIPGDTVYIPAENVDLSFLIDSLYHTLQPVTDTFNLCPGVVAEANRTILAQSQRIKSLQAQYRPCVPDTIRITGQTVWRENTARVQSLTYQAADLTAARDRYKEGRNWWRTACLITWGLIALYILYRIFKSKLMRLLPVLLLATIAHGQTYITPSGDTVIIKGRQAVSAPPSTSTLFKTDFSTLAGLNTQQALPGGLTIEGGKLKAQVRAGGASVSSGWRAEVQIPDLKDEGIREYEYSMTMTQVGSGSSGHVIQWHPDNSGGSAVLSLWISGGVFTVVNNPSGANSNTYTELFKYEVGKTYDFKWRVNWTTGDVELWVDGIKWPVKQPSDKRWKTGRYLKFGINLFNKSSSATVLYDDLIIK